MATSSFAIRESPTKIKLLNGLTIMCEHQGCETPAAYLFRTGSGPLPDPVEKALASGW